MTLTIDLSPQLLAVVIVLLLFNCSSQYYTLRLLRIEENIPGPAFAALTSCYREYFYCGEVEDLSSTTDCTKKNNGTVVRIGLNTRVGCRTRS